MKVFLSPLFLASRFCKHCVSGYYAKKPDGFLWRYELARMPPLGMFDPARGFMPDLPVFLMFDQFLIDQQAIASIKRNAHKNWLGAWPEIVGTLEAEGCLESVDATSVLKRCANLRSRMTRQDLRNPARWGAAMDFHDSLLLSADSALGDRPETGSAVDWSFDPGKVTVLRTRDDKKHHLARGVLRGKPPDEVHERLRAHVLGQLRMQLSDLNAGLAVSMTLGASPMVWAPYAQYMKAKIDSADSVRVGMEQQESARLFFDVAFPKFRPETVAQLSMLRRDKRLRSLRLEIERAYSCGEVLDRMYPQAILQETLKIERRVGRLRRISTWVSGALSFVPGVGAAASVGGELVGSTAESVMRRRLDWLYLISDGVGHS